MVLPGIQALFGFQLMAVFSPGFWERLDSSEQRLHLTMAYTSPQGIQGTGVESTQEHDAQPMSLFEEEHGEGHSRSKREIQKTTIQGFELNVYSHCYGD